MNPLKKIDYQKLKSRQKENYNFQKVSALLADYGFNTLRLSDDWQGADFIANHIDGQTFLKIQLKGRLTFDNKYAGKDVWMCFPHKKIHWYLFPHDEVMKKLSSCTNFMNTSSWKKSGTWHTATPSKRDLEILSGYKL